MMGRNERKSDVLMRLRRIEGQLRGLQRMVEEETPCSEVLTQVAAVTAAIKRAGMVIIQSHMEECLQKVVQKAGSKERETLKDFQKAMSRYIDWA
jgi:DNA-binding FrmR family transcriptional regulator